MANILVVHLRFTCAAECGRMVHILRISLDDEKYLYLEILTALHWYLRVNTNEKKSIQ